jgi:hypothetical protein
LLPTPSQAVCSGKDEPSCSTRPAVLSSSNSTAFICVATHCPAEAPADRPEPAFFELAHPWPISPCLSGFPCSDRRACRRTPTRPRSSSSCDAPAFADCCHFSPKQSMVGKMSPLPQPAQRSRAHLLPPPSLALLLMVPPSPQQISSSTHSLVFGPCTGADPQSVARPLHPWPIESPLELHQLRMQLPRSYHPLW